MVCGCAWESECLGCGGGVLDGGGAEWWDEHVGEDRRLIAREGIGDEDEERG